MNYTELQEKFPYITVIKHFDNEYVCIFQNHDDKIVSFYNIDSIKSPEEKKLLLHLADIWWFESNRKLPISIFLSAEMKVFKKYIRTLPMKDTEFLFGPTVSLNALVQKRIKRREVKLVRKV
jgi:hypothetical protein